MADITTQCTVDLEKNRIRIHKETLHQMGNPKYVQFLVNEEKRLFAIHHTNSPFCGSTHKVGSVSSDTCVEIYSAPLCEKLVSAFDTLHTGNCYHLSGWIHPDDEVAVFSVASARRIEQEVEP